MGYLLRHALQLVSAVVIGCTFLCYLAPFVSPAFFRWLAFFGTAFPWLLFGHLLLAAVWVFRLHRYAIYHVGMIALGWTHVTAFIGLNVGQQVAPAGAIVVASHNVGGLFRGIHLEQEEWDSIITHYVRIWKEGISPTVLCVQETSRKFFLRLGPRLGFPHVFELGRSGTAILSQYPVLRGGWLPFEEPENTSMWADLQVGQHIVRVYNVHLQSNRVTYDTQRIVKEAPIDSKDTWKGVGQVIRKVGDATAIRARQAKMLRNSIASCPYPVIVCGDFNDTPTSYVYNQVSKGLKDTFRERGFGWGTTFGGAIPFLRIDYVLCAPVFEVYSCQVIRCDISDHYPVVAAISLSEQEQ
ncbi:MAG: endonuclease/exonuclease/phosphatase family protein [Saprospiraceae bacterium]|nr:endonuclease/exonuclease/phosphatase family protein [Saprospiraceae bacterium]MDW8483774.1 endonuclease/exonuclease/phosphatase family protein [Saprospiraceae bacterium]